LLWTDADRAQLPARPAATGRAAGLTLAGGKGINVARALKRLDVPGRRDGLVGGLTGTRIVEQLTGEAILNDFVRIADESRTSTAVVDPTTSSYTEINEWGPHVEPEELDMLREKLRYLATAADTVIFAGSLPRGVEDDFYGEPDPRAEQAQASDRARRGRRAAAHGNRGEPFLVSPNQREAESLVGQEFHEDQDFIQALDDIAELGARNVLITQESGCFALLREEREVKAAAGRGPRRRTCFDGGSGDVSCPPSSRARDAKKPIDEALRSAGRSRCGLDARVGAGRFDPREGEPVAGVSS
jgi:1-phosphofructokinase/tagatose 6-phosphate kinase